MLYMFAGWQLHSCSSPEELSVISNSVLMSPCHLALGEKEVQYAYSGKEGWEQEHEKIERDLLLRKKKLKNSPRSFTIFLNVVYRGSPRSRPQVQWFDRKGLTELSIYLCSWLRFITSENIRSEIKKGKDVSSEVGGNIRFQVGRASLSRVA